MTQPCLTAISDSLLIFCWDPNEQANLSKPVRARVITYFQWKLSCPSRRLPILTKGLPDHISAVLKMCIYSKAVKILFPPPL